MKRVHCYVVSIFIPTMYFPHGQAYSKHFTCIRSSNVLGPFTSNPASNLQTALLGRQRSCHPTGGELARYLGSSRHKEEIWRIVKGVAWAVHRLQTQAGEEGGLAGASLVGHLGWIQIDVTTAGAKQKNKSSRHVGVRTLGRRNSKKSADYS